MESLITGALSAVFSVIIFCVAAYAVWKAGVSALFSALFTGKMAWVTWGLIICVFLGIVPLLWVQKGLVGLIVFGFQTVQMAFAAIFETTVQGFTAGSMADAAAAADTAGSVADTLRAAGLTTDAQSVNELLEEMRQAGMLE